MPTQTFFMSWPTWAQLSFVLGGSLVLVLSVAGLVKLHKFLEVQRATRLHGNDVERAETRQRVRSSDEIPFGTKAMLEDPDIEGVWNSRASTPLQSPILAPRGSSPSRHSLNPFSRSRRNSSVSSIPSLAHFRLPDASFDDNVHQEGAGLPSPTESFSASNGNDTMTAHARHENTWHSGTQLAQPQENHMPRRRSVTIRSVSKPEPANSYSSNGQVAQPHRTKVVIRGSSQSQGSRVSTDPVPQTPKRANALHPDDTMDPVTMERTPTTKKALDRMEAHRKFHAAESGQLQPRPRTADDKAGKHKHSASDTTVNDIETTRAVSWPITQGEVLVDFTAPRKVQTGIGPNIVPFRAFVEMHPPPNSTPKAPPSAWTEKTQDLLDEKLQAQTPKKRSTIKNNSVVTRNAKELYIISSRESSEDEQEAASLLGTQSRKINDGFEILPAGTLEESLCVKDFGFENKPLQESSNNSRPRKLQKRNRSLSRERRTSLDMVPRIKA